MRRFAVTQGNDQNKDPTLKGSHKPVNMLLTFGERNSLEIFPGVTHSLTPGYIVCRFQRRERIDQRPQLSQLFYPTGPRNTAQGEVLRRNPGKRSKKFPTLKGSHNTCQLLLAFSERIYDSPVLGLHPRLYCLSFSTTVTYWSIG